MQILEKIFCFVLIFLVVLACGSGLIPQKNKEEKWDWKDVSKLAVFAGIFAYIGSILF